MEFNIAANRTTESEQAGRRQVGKVLLLLVELLAVAGLLLAAVHLWQVRQTLHEDLKVAQEVEAVIQSGGAIPAVAGEGSRTLNAGSGSGAPWQTAPTSEGSSMLQELWFLVGAGGNDS